MSNRKLGGESEWRQREVAGEGATQLKHISTRAGGFFFLKKKKKKEGRKKEILSSLFPTWALRSPAGSDDYRAAKQAAALPAQRHECGGTPGGRQGGHPGQRSERRAPSAALRDGGQRGHPHKAVQ